MSDKPSLSKLLIEAGYCPRVAKALAWLILCGKEVVTSREIERGADLRQPEVHYAVTLLGASDWLETISTPPLQKRGRPFIQYKMRRNKEQAFNEIKSQMDRRTEAIRNTIEMIHDAIFTTAQTPAAPPAVQPQPEENKPAPEGVT